MILYSGDQEPGEAVPTSATEPMSFQSRDEWRAWLAENHETAREAWLVHPKKASGLTGLRYEEAVEEALCFGWIDGRLRALDGERFSLRYSPRRRGSIWSDSNKRRVARLTEEGRMTAAGLAAVAEAKESGEWDAATAREDVTVIPDDLLQELTRLGAVDAFTGWSASRRKQYLYWLSSAKRAGTRQKRLSAIVEMADRTKDEQRRGIR